MLPPLKFYDKNALPLLESFIKLREKSNTVIYKSELKQEKHALSNKFPILFNYHKKRRQDIWFYEKYLRTSRAKQWMEIVLNQLRIDKKQLKFQFQDTLQPKLKQKLSLYKNTLKIDKFQVKSVSNISHKFLTGVFMHRNLNMSSQNFTTQMKKKQDHLVYNMKTKDLSLANVSELLQKRQLYMADQGRLMNYYVDKYQNFIKHDKIQQYLIQVQAEIKGEIKIKGMKEQKLPLNQNWPITTHLLQIQKLDIPGRQQKKKYMITDIDYFMSGNPFTI